MSAAAVLKNIVPIVCAVVTAVDPEVEPPPAGVTQPAAGTFGKKLICSGMGQT
jgi:hypothetical protein